MNKSGRGQAQRAPAVLSYANQDSGGALGLPPSGLFLLSRRFKLRHCYVRDLT